MAADLKEGEPYITACPNCDHEVDDHHDAPTYIDSKNFKPFQHCSKCKCPLTRDYVVRAIMICAVYAYRYDG